MRPITAQEKKILNLIGQGYSTSQIAYTFGISSHTVESHRKNLLTKFDAKNAAELILKAIEANVLKIKDPYPKTPTPPHLENNIETKEDYPAA